MKKIYFISFISVLSLYFFLFPKESLAASNINNTKGYILLQVESHGEAWYVDPVSLKRSYMKDGDAAYEMLRRFGLGITDKDLEKIPVEGSKEKGNQAFVNKMKGRIFLQVQQKGEAWYVYPKDGKRYYLKNGEEAYRIMRILGLGITNNNLNKISTIDSVNDSQVSLNGNGLSNKEMPITPSPKRGLPLSNTEIIKHVKPATVFIETTEGSGSGMIIDISGYILTNAHVVSDVSVAKVTLPDSRLFSAKVVGRDEIIDLAILKIVGTNFPIVTLGNSNEVSQGDEIFTLGYPFGGDVSFKEGTISRIFNYDGAKYLEVSAEIHPGNSGGPLVNRYGEVIGINSAGYSPYQLSGVIIGEALKLAIPINVANNLIPELKNGRNVAIPKTPPPDPAPKLDVPPQLLSVSESRSDGVNIKVQFDKPVKCVVSWYFNSISNGGKEWATSTYYKSSFNILIPFPSNGYNADTIFYYQLIFFDETGNHNFTAEKSIRPAGLT